MVVAHAGMFVAACMTNVVLFSSNVISGFIFRSFLFESTNCSSARYLIIGSARYEYHNSNPIGPNLICDDLWDGFWFVRWFRAWRVRGGASEEGVHFVEPLLCGAHDECVLLVGPLVRYFNIVWYLIIGTNAAQY